MAKKFPIHPKHPERICWGCDKYCQHPIELDGPEWYKNGDWSSLLSKEQQIELGLIPAEPEPAPKPKPHIKLPVKH